MANFYVVGKEYPPIRFTVERGKIGPFALSLRDDHPVYHDEAYAAAVAGGILAPPTFLRNFWIEGTQVHQDLGFEWSRVLHGEQEFEYFKPVRAGDVLTAHMRVAEMYEKEGKRGGKMTFAVIETVFRDESGDVVQIARRTLIETQRPESPVSSGETPPPPARVERPPFFDEVQVGQESPRLRVGPLTRTDFVRYAGASGDFNPIHHDELYAIRSGSDRVFGHGMLGAGYLARLVTDWFGPGQLRRFRVRFRDRIWPGDVLECYGRVVAAELGGQEGLITCELVAENQHRVAVCSGTAVVGLPMRGSAR